MSILVLIFLLTLYAGLIYLQIFLSKKDSAWPGMVLPVLFFLASLVVPLSLIAPENGESGGFVLSIVLICLLDCVYMRCVIK